MSPNLPYWKLRNIKKQNYSSTKFNRDHQKVVLDAVKSNSAENKYDAFFGTKRTKFQNNRNSNIAHFEVNFVEPL